VSLLTFDHDPAVSEPGLLTFFVTRTH